MPTEELENELRRVFARAAADIQDPQQAGQRLLRRDYRPGRGRRRLAAGVTAVAAVAAAGAAVLGLGLAGTFKSAPASADSTIRTTAFTLVKHADGTATLTLNWQVLLEPGTLQSDLRQDGIPAIVTTGSLCTSDPMPAGFSQVVTATQPGQTFTINPSAMPAGTELSFGNFQDGNSGRTIAELVNTASYTCSPHASLPKGGLVIGFSRAPGGGTHGAGIN
jgi:hypothetical protein